MDPNVAALLGTMKQQQQQFVEALTKLTHPEPVAQTVTSPPKAEKNGISIFCGLRSI